MVGFYTLLVLAFVYNLAFDFSKLQKHRKLFWAFGIAAFFVLVTQYGK